jgi:hypothetical protein
MNRSLLLKRLLLAIEKTIFTALLKATFSLKDSSFSDFGRIKVKKRLMLKEIIAADMKRDVVTIVLPGYMR